jgi:parallel beta-helix repeat protein
LALDDAVGAAVTLHAVASTRIVGNYIGLELDGSTTAGSTGDGVEVDFGSSNVIQYNTISGNGRNGISLSSSAFNTIAANSIGTDVTGIFARPNGANGILVTNHSSYNTIGGAVSGGNDPTKGIFVRPPAGNLISGNNADGVLITGGSVLNVLNGNFIGTDVTGDLALGNLQDGVAIVGANFNSLIGCTSTDSPFIYYNVLSGNGGNGLRVDNSNYTKIYANFFGLGKDNQTPVGNSGNGVVIEGSSTGTAMGGKIPLGNVVAANLQNGVVVKDTASNFISFNTFSGLAAFENYTNLGNGQDGILITSSGGNILVRTNVFSGNGNDGIEVTGAARDVHISLNIVGLNTPANAALPNKNNGIEVGGNAHDIEIGGVKDFFSIAPKNIIGCNLGNGIAITGNAHNVVVNFSSIGTEAPDTTGTLGNKLAGIYLGPGTHSNTIGSSNPALSTVISANGGDGIQIDGSSDNKILKCLIGVNTTNTGAFPNGGNGISITNGFNNTIGGSLVKANVIAFNDAHGVLLSGGFGNAILANSIYNNVLSGIDLTNNANLNQAAPVLNSLQVNSSIVRISGTLTSRANTVYLIEFFANQNSGASGQKFLGRAYLVTNGKGVATFTFVGSRPPAGYNFFTATATDLKNNTSKFSAPVP